MAFLSDDLHGFAALLPPSKALMALDVGTKTVGVAFTDSDRRVAFPYGFFPRLPFATCMDSCISFMESHSIGALVVGYPLEMSGHAGKRCQAIHDFCLNFLKRYAIPILLQDERLSTVASHHMLARDVGMGYAKRTLVVDSVAALWILETVLGRLMHLKKIS